MADRYSAARRNGGPRGRGAASQRGRAPAPARERERERAYRETAHPAGWGLAAAVFFILALGLVYILAARPANMQDVLDAVKGLGGSLSLLLPVAAVFAGVECARTAAGRGAGFAKKAGGVLFVLLLYAAVHIFSTPAIVMSINDRNFFNFIHRSYEEAAGGGAVGAILSWPVYRILGSVGLGFFAIAVLMLGVLAATGILGRLWTRLSEALERDEEWDEPREERRGAGRARPEDVPAYMERKGPAQRRGAREPARASERDRERELYDRRGSTQNRVPAVEEAAPRPRRKSASADGSTIPARPAAPAKKKQKNSDIGMDAFLNAEPIDLGGSAAAPSAKKEDAAALSAYGVADNLVDIPAAQQPLPAKPKPSFGVSEAEDGQQGVDDIFDIIDDLPPVPKNAPKKQPEKEQKAAKDVAVTGIDRKRPAPKKPAAEEKDDGADAYPYPPIDLLATGAGDVVKVRGDRDAEKAELLCSTLESFGISAHLTGIAHGPAVTRFELAPAAGVKVSRITSLADDIALNLAARSVRIEAPIPGKAAVGVEIPNDQVMTVRLRDVLESQSARSNPSRLAVGLGMDNSGSYVVADIARMPHVLIAGQTGSGKSVCINSIIVSILYRAKPDEVQMILIDPKVVELSIYNDIPHLITPVVTDPKKAASALDWAVAEMGRRYKKFADAGVRDIKGYNKKLPPDEKIMPQIVIIIDELADLMMVVPGEVEDSICRIAQLARAAGMHLVIATQRPSVNVVTGIIKANIPTRIAFSVASQVDSRTMIDHGGAEKLLGNGDMLYVPSGINKPIRVQGSWVSDEEVQKIVDYVRQSETPNYDPDLMEHMERADKSDAEKEEMDSELDDKLQEAIRIVVEAGQASTSMLQRKMRVGYARAGRLIDEMELRGVVGPANGAKPRDVLLTRAQYRSLYETEDHEDAEDDAFDIMGADGAEDVEEDLEEKDA